jgi:hypothetical protein
MAKKGKREKMRDKRALKRATLRARERSEMVLGPGPKLLEAIERAKHRVSLESVPLQCNVVSDGEGVECVMPAGHKGAHEHFLGESSSSRYAEICEEVRMQRALMMEVGGGGNLPDIAESWRQSIHLLRYAMDYPNDRVLNVGKLLQYQDFSDFPADCDFHRVPLEPSHSGDRQTKWCPMCERDLIRDDWHPRQCPETIVRSGKTLQCGSLDGHEHEHGDWAAPCCDALVLGEPDKTYFRCNLDQAHPGEHEHEEMI